LYERNQFFLIQNPSIPATIPPYTTLIRSLWTNLMKTLLPKNTLESKFGLALTLRPSPKKSHKHFSILLTANIADNNPISDILQMSSDLKLNFSSSNLIHLLDCKLNERNKD